MNVQFRIITEDNVNNMLSMTYSDNIIKLTKDKISFEEPVTSENIVRHVDMYKRMADKLTTQLANATDKTIIKKVTDTETSNDTGASKGDAVSEQSNQEVNATTSNRPNTPTGAVDQPNEIGSSSQQYAFVKESDNTESTIYNPLSSDTDTESNQPITPVDTPLASSSNEFQKTSDTKKFENDELTSIYNTMSPQNKEQLNKLTSEEQVDILKRVESKRGTTGTDEDNTKTSILEVEEEKKKSSKEGSDDEDIDDISDVPAPAGALKKVDFNM